MAVWSSNLTNDEINHIERVQKAAFAIILAEQYGSYNHALSFLERTTLTIRRKKITLNFGKKSLKSDKYKHWFKEFDPSEKIQNRESSKLKKPHSVEVDPFLCPVQARTSTYARSPLAYITDLINEDKIK